MGDESGRGRPSVYSQEKADAICARLSLGEPLSAICRSETMPGRTTVWDWMQRDAAFSERIARAREDGFDALAAECLEIADDDSRDWEPVRKDGEIVDIKVDGEHIQRSKVRIDTRLKLLSKWDPKRYGDKVELEHSGKVGHELSADDTFAAIATAMGFPAAGHAGGVGGDGGVEGQSEA